MTFDLREALPLLDALEYAITDFMDRRRKVDVDIVMVTAAIHALGAWSAQAMLNRHGLNQKHLEGMQPMFKKLAQDLMLMMHNRRTGGNKNAAN